MYPSVLFSTHTNLENCMPVVSEAKNWNQPSRSLYCFTFRNPIVLSFNFCPESEHLPHLPFQHPGPNQGCSKSDQIGPDLFPLWYIQHSMKYRPISKAMPLSCLKPCVCLIYSKYEPILAYRPSTVWHSFINRTSSPSHQASLSACCYSSPHPNSEAFFSSLPTLPKTQFSRYLYISCILLLKSLVPFKCRFFFLTKTYLNVIIIFYL